MPLSALRHRRGSIIGAAGNMTSGKTSWLVGTACKPSKQRAGVAFIQPTNACRTKPDLVQSRTFATFTGAVGARRPKDFLRLVGRAEFVFLEEIEFYEEKSAMAAEFEAVIEHLVLSGRTIYWSGLPVDFRGDPFMVVARMMALSERLVLLEAECAKCAHEPAHFAQRLIFGHPAPRNHPRFVPDTPAYRRQGITYEPRCVDCYEPPGEPNEHLRAIWSLTKRRSTRTRPRR